MWVYKLRDSSSMIMGVVMFWGTDTKPYRSEVQDRPRLLG